MQSDPAPTPTIDVHAAAQRQQDGALILDVREQHEWDAGHIPGALHIPLGELADRIGELPADRPIVAVCRSGARSEHATDALNAHGQDVVNLAGGSKAWHAAGLPLDPPDGHVA